MFQIGEFSRLVRVSPRMLRHYEKCGLIYPARVDAFTGYRQYAAEQIALLSRITELRDVGFSIDEIGDILGHFGDGEYLLARLEGRRLTAEASIEAEREKLGKLSRLRDRLTKKENVTMAYEVILKELPAVPALTLRETISDYSKEGELWGRLSKFMAAHGVACPDGEIGGYSIYWDDDYKETDEDVEIAVPVAALGKSEGGFTYRTLEAIPLAATLRWQGPYDGGYQATTEKLAAWMEANGYAFAGPVRGCSIHTPADQSDPNNYLTELQIPVRKKY
jgi:DNA-binding transcriptional MerR regulator